MFLGGKQIKVCKFQFQFCLFVEKQLKGKCGKNVSELKAPISAVGLH